MPFPQQSQCQVSRPNVNDITAQNAIACGAPSEYCPNCGLYICSSCHKEVSSVCPA